LADFLSFFQTKPSLCPLFAYFSYILSRSGRIWLQSLKKVTKYFEKIQSAYQKTQNFMLILKKVEKLQKSKFFLFLLMIKIIWVTIFFLIICSTFSPICCATNVTVVLHQSKNLDLNTSDPHPAARHKLRLVGDLETHCHHCLYSIQI
jgi:hypothetical protein